MKKGRMSNVLQRTFIFGSIATLMAGIVFNTGNLVNADGTTASKVEKCALQSVSLKVTTDENAEEEVYSSGLKTVTVGKDVNWTDYFSIRAISGTEYITEDTCTAKKYYEDNPYEPQTHCDISGYIYLPNYTGEEVLNTYHSNVQRKEGDSGAWAEWISANPYKEGQYNNKIYYEEKVDDDSCEEGYYIKKNGYVKLNEEAGYYDVKFEPRYGMVNGVSPTGIYVRFAKQYAITYDLTGGTVTGAEEIYTAGTEYTLPTPTKEGYYFAGWTGADLKEPTVDVVISKDATGDRKYTANWVKNKNIFDCDISLKDGEEYIYTDEEIKPVVVIKDGDTVLTEGVDYTVEYMNNVNVPTKDSSDLPTITVMGIGKYTGVSVFYFTIKSDLPEVGEKQEDKSGKATYKVTKSAEGKMEVTYVAPTNKSKTVSVPATVTLEDGTKAKVTSVAAKAFKGNTKVQTVTIGKNVKTIGKEAFSGCKNLKKVKSATNVTSIGNKAFANCKNLNSVAMGSKVTTIGDQAFYKCTKLTKITIPKNVKSIGKSAFQGCSKLKTIDIKTTKLTKKSVKKNAFKGIHSKAKIDVPNSKVKAYKSILKARGVGKNVTIK